MDRGYGLVRAAWLASIQLCVVSFIAQGGNLLRNAEFEAVDGDGHVCGWNYVPGDYHLEEAAGMNGTRGMVFRAKGSMIGTPLLQRVRVTPGIRYHYGAWAKVENLTGNSEACARVCLLWEDNWGRLMDNGCFLGARPCGTTDWTKIEADSPVMPVGAKWMTIRVEVIGSVNGGSVAYFDDAFLEPMVVPPVGQLYCSAYRDTKASGQVTFVAGINKFFDRPALPTTAMFTYVGADGAKKSKSVAIRDSREAVGVFAVEEMALGETEVMVEAFLADGTSYGKSSMKFTRAASDVRRHIDFDQFGRTLVDGSPFFPLGMYWSVSKPYHKFQLPPMTPENLAEYAKGPFNCVMPYAPPSREQLDAATRLNIKVIYPLLAHFENTDKWDPSSWAAKSARRAIESFKGHPALLGWYLQDERPISMIEQLVGRHELVKACDPDHPTWSVSYAVDQIRDFMSSFDVVGTDPYPIPNQDYALAWNAAAKTHRGTFGIRPLWQVVQAFDWGTFREKDKDRYRMPTREEMANLAWQHIAGGANGLIFYSYTYLMQCTKTPFEKAWADVQSVGREISALQDVLLADGKPPKFISDNAKVVVRGWSMGGVRYLLAVNTTLDGMTANVTADGAVGSVKPMLGRVPTKVEGNVLTVELAPISQTLLELR